MAVDQRIDMSLVDEKVLAFITASDNKALTFLEIARGVRCAPITVRRSVHRLRAAGRLQFSPTPGRVFRFTPTDGEPRAE